MQDVFITKVHTLFLTLNVVSLMLFLQVSVVGSHSCLPVHGDECAARTQPAHWLGWECVESSGLALLGVNTNLVLAVKRLK